MTFNEIKERILSLEKEKYVLEDEVRNLAKNKMLIEKTEYINLELSMRTYYGSRETIYINDSKIISEIIEIYNTRLQEKYERLNNISKELSEFQNKTI
jgi:tRNA(Phe) wybutosine-synthesizing methylase Tyw3